MVLLSTVLSILLHSCGSTTVLPVASCIKENQQDLLIRWGTKNDSTLDFTEYRMDTRGSVSKIYGNGTDSSMDELSPVPSPQYCAAIEQLTKVFVKVQALHSPGTKARFIEYTNPRSNVYLRAVWNPDLSTFQSRDMRAQYDSLMKLIGDE